VSQRFQRLLDSRFPEVSKFQRSKGSMVPEVPSIPEVTEFQSSSGFWTPVLGFQGSRGSRIRVRICILIT